MNKARWCLWSRSPPATPPPSLELRISGSGSPRPRRCSLESNELLASNGQLVRARVVPSAGATASLASFQDGGAWIQGICLEGTLAPGSEGTTLFALPFLPRLTSLQRRQLGALNYEQERAKVAAYWRAIAESGVRFDVPEPRLVSFSRAMLVHLRLSTTKDPKSGLFMVPAASYDYQVFANESCFQILALDALGDHQTAADYLETFIQLQGSKPFPGTYSGDQRAVYHGAKVNPDYDYTAADYNLDHGTVLWTLAEHYFMTRDQRWLAHAAPGMVRAADWITEQRRQTMALEDGQPVAEYGLLPAGHLEDNPDWGHWFAVNAYASAGMSRLGEALRETGHPEAARINRDAEAFRADLRQAVIRVEPGGAGDALAGQHLRSLCPRPPASAVSALRTFAGGLLSPLPQPRPADLPAVRHAGSALRAAHPAQSGHLRGPGTAGGLASR